MKLEKRLGGNFEYFIAMTGHDWATARKADAVSFVKSILQMVGRYCSLQGYDR